MPKRLEKRARERLRLPITESNRKQVSSLCAKKIRSLLVRAFDWMPHFAPVFSLSFSPPSLLLSLSVPPRPVSDSEQTLSHRPTF